ncbi:MAG: insulinase family protein [Nannocystaceae bacterium]|nr:insulinase family protein [Nannocystaceae bacterium]
MARMGARTLSPWYAALLALLVLACRPTRTDRHTRAPTQPDAHESVAHILAASDLPEPLATPLPDDPLGVTIHRLDNGLTVYLSTQRTEPRVRAWIAVRAGSRHEPVHATGLAHYLEHMLLFKGTDELGTIDHAAELPHLRRTRELYRALREAAGEAERRRVLGAIDEQTQAIARTSVANESIALFERLGITGVDAFTDLERTHYVATVPSNRVAQWAAIEAEQLADPSFRLFLPELEAVYEEKNRQLDDPGVRRYAATMKALFGRHRYGASVLGEVEHLETPDFDAMIAFFESWYVPNAMAIILVGDVDEGVLPLLQRHFGAMRPRRLPEPPPGKANALTGRTVVPLPAPGTPLVSIAWPTVSVHHDDALVLELATAVLADPRMGLIARTLVQPGVAAQASAWSDHLHEGGYLGVVATVRDDLTHERIEAALREAVAGLASAGDDRVASQRLYTEMAKLLEAEQPAARARRILDAFVRHEPWPRVVAEPARLAALGPADLRRVAQQYLGEASVVVVQQPGEVQAPRLHKPEITPLQFATGPSAFAERIAAQPVTPIEPAFAELGRDFEHRATAFGELTAVRNTGSPLFRVRIEIDRGSRTDPLLCHALQAWASSGSRTLAAEALQTRLAALGAFVGSECGSDRSAIEIEGIDAPAPDGEDRFAATMTLVKAWLDAPVFDDARLAALARAEVSARAAALDDDDAITEALREVAYFGEDAASKAVPSTRAIEGARAPALAKLLSGLLRTRHGVRYFGPRALADALPQLQLGKGDRKPPVRWVRRYRTALRPEIHVVHRGSAKANVHVVVPAPPSDPTQTGAIAVLGELLGRRMFDDVRVARALAYAVWAGFDPGDAGDDASLWARAQTQPDKVDRAVTSMLTVLLHQPIDAAGFERASASLRESLRARRTQPRSLAAAVGRWLDRGLPGDPSALMWAQLPTLDASVVQQLRDGARGPAFITIVGDTARMDLAALEALGPVTVHEPATLFGFDR